MTKPTKPTADELARSAANRLQIRTGWYISTAGNRIVPRITPADVDRLIERLDNSDQWEALQVELDEISRGGGDGGDAA